MTTNEKMKPGKYADAYANDQDWALVAYLDFIGS